MAYRTDNEVVAFLYELMRDHVTPGVLERIVTVHEDVKIDEPFDFEFELSNVHLARYAEELARRLGALSNR